MSIFRSVRRAARSTRERVEERRTPTGAMSQEPPARQTTQPPPRGIDMGETAAALAGQSARARQTAVAQAFRPAGGTLAQGAEAARATARAVNTIVRQQGVSVEEAAETLRRTAGDVRKARRSLARILRRHDPTAFDLTPARARGFLAGTRVNGRQVIPDEIAQLVVREAVSDPGRFPKPLVIRKPRRRG